jgi:hypothetical protein
MIYLPNLVFQLRYDQLPSSFDAIVSNMMLYAVISLITTFLSDFPHLVSVLVYLSHETHGQRYWTQQLYLCPY